MFLREWLQLYKAGSFSESQMDHESTKKDSVAHRYTSFADNLNVHPPPPARPSVGRRSIATAAITRALESLTKSRSASISKTTSSSSKPRSSSRTPRSSSPPPQGLYQLARPCDSKVAADQRFISFADDLNIQPPSSPPPITESTAAAALAKARESLKTSMTAPISRLSSSSSTLSHYLNQHGSPINSTASIDAIAPTKSVESFGTLQALLEKGDVFTATYSHFSWEREDDVAIFCSACRRVRCDTCHGEAFAEMVGLGEKLTVENRNVKICTPCKHGLCWGGILRLITKEWDNKVIGGQGDETLGIPGRRKHDGGLRGVDVDEDW